MAFFGETFAGLVVFAVEIAAGLEMVLAVVGFSGLLAAAGFPLPLVYPFDGPLATFFSSTCIGFAVSFKSPPPSLLSDSCCGVSIADSGIVSLIAVLFFLASNSVAIDSFRCAVSFG